jgi:hypothetical protein
MQRLAEMRALYEGYAEALSRYLCMPLPPWISSEPRKDNWLTVARLRAQAETPAETGEVRTPSPVASLHEDHDF